MLKLPAYRILAAGVVILSASLSHAAVQGLYLFDTISNPTPAEAPFEILADSSGNGRDIVRQEAYGTVSLDTNRPAVMPGGTFALNSNAGGSGSLITDSTGAFSVANTGALTVEFWYQRKHSGLVYLLEYGNESANGWDIYEFNGVIHALFRTNVNSFSTMVAPEALAVDEWNHIAVTFAADGVGTLYINGDDVATQNYTPANYSVPTTFLRLGAGAGGSYSNIALFDELRISDVALLPGSGSGVGELAWDASLVVPEPVSMGAIATFTAALMARRRKI